MSSPTANSNTVARMVVPGASGYLLVVLAYVFKYVPFVPWIIARSGGLFELRDIPQSLLDLDVTTLGLPLDGYKRQHNDAGEALTAQHLAEAAEEKTPLASALAYHRAYLSGSLTPIEVCKSLLSKLVGTVDPSVSHRDHRKYFRSIIPLDALEQATESTARYAANAPLSPLDGVMVVLKNEVDVKGHVTRAGTEFVNDGEPALEDGQVAAQLKAMGAVVLGVTDMTEVGWGVQHHVFDNPFRKGHSCGGSSAGSAACVAAGYVPLAIGVDGGGSVRIPSAFCGLYGLKPTHTRVSSKGEFCSAPTVAVTGPMGANVDDMCLGYLAIADKEKAFPVHVPKSLYFKPSVAGLRIGVIREFNAQVRNPAITAALSRVEMELIQGGATIVPLAFPYLDFVRNAHAITISSELYSTVRSRKNNHKMMYQTVLLFSTLSQLSVTDYIHAQKMRTHAIRVLEQYFSGPEKVDFLLSPTAATTAPLLPANTTFGVSDNTLASDVIRYSFLANLAGNPAVTCPVGFDAQDLPVAVQFMGEWWSEGRLMPLAKWMENSFKAEGKRRAPLWDGLEF
ncbi:hypothetical protein HDU78_002135 [Chytriomyces hyalinus]|nr:hypothetical protein HDU78_002135 [Chytriomyces hyalinus]